MDLLLTHPLIITQDPKSKMLLWTYSEMQTKHSINKQKSLKLEYLHLENLSNSNIKIRIKIWLLAL